MKKKKVIKIADTLFLDKDFIVVLGSGNSIKELSQSQLQILNRAKVRIAINKFGGFYELAGIKPTHIFFYDDYSKSSILFLKYIFGKLRENGLKGITFIVSEKYKGYLFNNKFMYFRKTYCLLIMRYLTDNSIKLGRLIIKPIDIKLFNRFKKSVGLDFENIEFFRFGLLPKKSMIQYIEIQNWKTRGNFWANSLNQKLYHYRGSFTSVLNYISILYPNSNILLAGVDFNSPCYFFENELDKLKFETADWTTNISKKNKKHFSIIDFEGTKIDDELPFVINELKKTNNEMFSFSKNSYLVNEGFVKFIKS